MIHPKVGVGFIYEKFKQPVPSISEPPLPFMYSCMTILKWQIKTRPSILCVTQKRAFMPLYIVLGQQRACMPVYIGKSGDLVG